MSIIIYVQDGLQHLLRDDFLLWTWYVSDVKGAVAPESRIKRHLTLFLYQPKLPIFSGGSHLAHELVQHLIDRAVFVTGNEVSDDLVGEELITYLTSTLEGQDERPELGKRTGCVLTCHLRVCVYIR